MDADATSAPEGVQLQLDGFEGPLDLLLDLARRQQVELARISVVAMVDQFVAAVTHMRRTDVARAADWLVMAAWLTWLKSRLLLPPPLQAAQQGAQAGQDLVDRLGALDRIRSTAAWLDARPQLGRDTFERGHGLAPAGAVVVADLAGLFQACLDVLRPPFGPPPERCVPRHAALWTAAQARRRIQAMLERRPEAADLLACVPPLPQTVADRALRMRGAVASTLVAALELAREGQVALEQSEAFAAIGVLGAAAGSGPARDCQAGGR